MLWKASTSRRASKLLFLHTSQESSILLLLLSFRRAEGSIFHSWSDLAGMNNKNLSANFNFNALHRRLKNLDFVLGCSLASRMQENHQNWHYQHASTSSIE
mmetsp:Transcript_10591/g.26726  ORF Transcript_10591/g.26726 Transcript_10591/m.26726 type:complete len:101 (-) Transcript_10591:5127-5429(-)